MGLQNDRKEQTATIEKLRKDHDDSRSEANDAHRGAISIFNEQKKHESHIQRLQAEVHRANSAVENILDQSVANTQVERTRLQLNFNEMSMTIVTVRQELEESRAATTAARLAEEAGRQQLARMMDEQLV